MRFVHFFAAALTAMSVGNSACAQFSPLEHHNSAPEAISPLASLLGNLNNRIYGGYDSWVADQRWDPSRSHYVGNQPGYFYYPGIAAAGYTQFSVARTDKRSSINLSGVGEQFAEALRQSAAAIEGENAHTRLTYHYDTAGWLRAIHAEHLRPESQGYGEVDDSFSYTPRPGGGIELRWLHTTYTSSSGHSSSSYCPPMPSFHHTRDTSITTILFDAYRNPVRMTTYNASLWDTCRNGGPQWGLREYRYDEAGRLIHITDSSTYYGGRWREVIISWEEMPFARFRPAISANPRLAALGHPAVKAWLGERGPLTYLASRRVVKGFVHNINTGRGPSQYRLRPDSPSVHLDSAFFLLDAARQRVVSWSEMYGAAYGRDAMAFYTRSTGDGGRRMSIQYVPLPVTVSSAGDSLLLRAADLRQTDSVATPAGLLVLYSTSEDVGGSYNRTGPQRLLFGSPLSNPAAVTPKAATLISPQGAVRYVWTPYNIYQLTYR